MEGIHLISNNKESARVYYHNKYNKLFCDNDLDRVKHIFDSQEKQLAESNAKKKKLYMVLHFAKIEGNLIANPWSIESIAFNEFMWNKELLKVQDSSMYEIKLKTT